MRNSPMLRLERLPEAERDNAWAISGTLSTLSSLVFQFRTALQLLDFSKANRKPLVGLGECFWGEDFQERADHNEVMAQWSMMAARSGSIYIYEFHQSVKAVDNQLAKCPSLRALINREARKRANALFDSSFPDFAKVRHFAAHGSEMTSYPDDIARHSSSDIDRPEIVMSNGHSVTINGSLMDRTYASTYEGRLVSYDLSDESANKLDEILTERFRMFEPATI